jgi:hypothetical protein
MHYGSMDAAAAGAAVLAAASAAPASALLLLLALAAAALAVLLRHTRAVSRALAALIDCRLRPLTRGGGAGSSLRVVATQNGAQAACCRFPKPASQALGVGSDGLASGLRLHAGC